MYVCLRLCCNNNQIDLNVHTGYKGELSRHHAGDVALYYANHCMEIIFAVSTLIPLSFGNIFTLFVSRFVSFFVLVPFLFL
jgi:hypothetical protein